MKTVSKLFSIIMLIQVLIACDVEIEIPQQHQGKYIDSREPNDSALIFSKGFISRYMAERDAAFSPDGKAFYYSVWLPNRKGVIMECKFVNNAWSEPAPIFFSGQHSDIEPALSPDGNRLYFASNRKVNDTLDQGYDIWFVEKINGIWSKPINARFPVNTQADEFYPSVSKNKNIYLTRGYGNKEKIVCCKYQDSTWLEAEILSDSVNASPFQFNAFIDPDEKFLIYSSAGRKDGLGGGDLYINYRKKDQTWAKAINMGERINTRFLDYCPYISPDGNYFFFTSGKIQDSINNKTLESLSDLEKLFHSNENGHSDLYWISTDVFKEFRK